MNPHALFQSNPPSDESYLSEVFVGRKREIERLKKYVPFAHPGVIQAIHGGSRVGKSHLTLKFLQEMQDSHHKFIVQAAEGKRARLILQDLYEKIRDAVLHVEKPEDLDGEGVGSAGILAEAHDMIQLTDQLMLDGESSREISISNSYKSTAGFKSLACLLNIPVFELNSTTEAHDVFTTKVSIAAPSDHRIVDFIRELCEVLYLTTKKRCLIYIDDVDLLDIGSSIDQDQVTALVRLLHRLSESQCVTIIATMRTRHMTIAQKSLSELMPVNPLTDAEIEKIYEQHIRLYNDGNPIFSAGCLNELVQASASQIGTFLRTCRKFAAWADNKGLLDDNRLLTTDDLLSFYKSAIVDLRKNPDLRDYIDAIYKAIEKSQLTVALDPAVLRTELVYTLLEEPLGPDTPRNYTINQLVARVMKQQLQNAESLQGP